MTGLSDMPEEIVAFRQHAGWPCGQWTAEHLDRAPKAETYVRKSALRAERQRAAKLEQALHRLEARAAQLSAALRRQSLAIDVPCTISRSAEPRALRVSLPSQPDWSALP